MKTEKQLKDSTMIAAYAFAAATVLIVVYTIVGFVLMIKNLK